MPYSNANSVLYLITNSSNILCLYSNSSKCKVKLITILHVIENTC